MILTKQRSCALVPRRPSSLLHPLPDLSVAFVPWRLPCTRSPLTVHWSLVKEDSCGPDLADADTSLRILLAIPNFYVAFHPPQLSSLQALVLCYRKHKRWAPLAACLLVDVSRTIFHSGDLFPCAHLLYCRPCPPFSSPFESSAQLATPPSRSLSPSSISRHSRRALPSSSSLPPPLTCTAGIEYFSVDIIMA